MTSIWYPKTASKGSWKSECSDISAKLIRYKAIGARGNKIWIIIIS